MASNHRPSSIRTSAFHGIERLRICDSSIKPQVVSSNTNAASIMIGEKAADLVKGNRRTAEAAA
jgi:choline dehydrogenase